MKGIVLAGGSGSRLYPMSKVASKQLQPIYDKPMIYYPVATLMMAGIREILVISTPHDTPRFRDLMGDGSQWGIHLDYVVQPSPDGLAQAFVLGAEFIGTDPVTLILGDNLFYGRMGLAEAMDSFRQGALVWGYPVNDPERYGVVEFDATGRVLSIEEKPSKPRSRYAVPGLYVYDNTVVARARAQKPSPRGELEITDLNNSYLAEGALRVEKLGRGIAWLDTGTTESLLEASQFIHAIEARQGLKVCCPEEVAYRQGYLDRSGFAALLAAMPKSSYRSYLEGLLAEASE
ncbi:MAG TPA: glucose-1-phosphate thymidylyltransferase RfbA [Fibrobacteria bacterium]|nr:glucose-1-phosphate thymidylyltransferase RfbA [Fibrobacteria bacterium]